MLKEKISKGLMWLFAIGALISPNWAIAGQAVVSSQQKAPVEVKEKQKLAELKKDPVKVEATKEENTKVMQAQQIEPRLILEYKFDEPVVDIIWDEATMTVKEARALGIKGLEQRKASEVVKVQYPKVVFVASEKLGKKPRLCPGRESIGVPSVKSIKFLDKKGRLKKERFLQQYIPEKQRAAGVGMSKNKKYIAITTVKEEAEDGSVMDAETVVLNTEGEELWRARHYYGAVAISPNGKYILGSDVEWDEDPVRIFYKDGLIKEVKRNGSWKVKFSKDGNFVALSIGDYPREGEPKKYVVVFDDEGNELWRRNIAQGEVAYFSRVTEITEDDFIVITINIEKIVPDQPSKKLYFDKKGNLIKTEIINE